MSLHLRYWESPVGWLQLEGTDTHLTRLTRVSQPASLSSSSHPLLERAVEQLQDYFAGTRQQFDLPLQLAGTPFQQQVWEALQQTPYGKTWSYAELAAYIGNPRACRAVGSANGKNPIAILVPCHRVICSDGQLGGYALGLALKQQLLWLEQRHSR